MNLFRIMLLLFLGGMSGWLHAQASNCGDAIFSPFCNGIAQYPANFDGTGLGSGPQAPLGPNYDCLGTQGNPSYFSLTIDQSGSIDFILDNTSNLDIDFILWGPFSSVNSAQAACGSIGQGGTSGGVTDCSYSVLGQEPVSIPNAISGEVYILMVTNYTNQATNIFSTFNTGTGSVACPCDIPFEVDTLSVAFGNTGYLVDTINAVNQFVVCPNNTLGFSVLAGSNLNDTLNIYAPFTTANSVFANNTILSLRPGGPTRFDSIEVLTLLTPTNDEIGVNDFTIGLRNDIFTGGVSDSTCFDFVNVQVIVPGVKLTDRTCLSWRAVSSIDRFYSEHFASVVLLIVGNSSVALRLLFLVSLVRIRLITVPTSNSSSVNDSIILVVDYNYGGLCPMRDTMVLRYTDLTVSALALPDSVCSGSMTALDVILSNSLAAPICDDYTVSTIPFAPLTTTGGTAVTAFNATTTLFSADDEGISAALPIGFNFDFYCNTFSSFYIHTNGFITFDNLTVGPAYTGDPLPSAGEPENLIAMGWEDLDISNGGNINYYVVGTAPNRQLVVNLNGVANWLSTTATTTTQAILSEADNSIELHISSITHTASTVGIENGNGTLAHFPAVYPLGQASGPITSVAYRFKPRQNGPFYTWTPAATLNSNTTRNPMASPIATTTYSVEVTDGVCRYVDTTTVTVISNFPTPVITCDSSTLTSISFSWTDIGLPIATGFYEYSLDGGATWVAVGNALSTTITGLMGNTSYTILVRGNDGAGGTCPLSTAGTTTCTTTNPSCTGNPALNLALTITDPICNGDSTGCANVLVTGGSGNNNLGYSWSTGQVDTNLICNLAAGTYSLTVTDTVGSMNPPSNTIVYAEDFDGVSNWILNVATGTNGADNNFWTISSDEAGEPVGACGTAGGPNQSLHVTSALTPTQGALYNTGGFCPFLFCTETNMRAESPAFSTVGSSNMTFEFNYIAGGDALIDNASVVYNDGSGWQTLTNSIKSTVCTNGQGLWTRYSVALPASCDNQPAVQVGINWTNNDDLSGTDPSVAIDSVVISTMQGGMSTFVCVDSQTFIINEPTAVVLTIDSFATPTCDGTADGYIAVSATGGIPTYNYTWNNLATGDSLTGLNAGTFVVTVEDINGCSVVDSVTLTVPNPIVIALDSVRNTTCTNDADGQVFISVTGGTPAYAYNWSTGGTTDSIGNVLAGTYAVTVTDANGCFISDSFTLTAPTPVVITIDSLGDPTCTGAADGYLAVSVTGGTPGYSYSWSNAATSDSLTGLNDGTYTITATDVNGCSATNQAVLAAPNPIVITIDSTGNPTCNGSADGYIALTATGGTPAYTYSWNNTMTSDSIMGLMAGTYSVTVTDANGCSVTDQTTLTEPNLLILVIDSTGNPTCNGSADGYIAVSATGGTAPFTYLWNTASTSDSLINLNDGTYMVTVTDANGCTAMGQAILNVPNPIVATIDNVVNNSCAGQADGSIDVTALGGLGSLSYLWSNGAVSQDLASVADGIYTLTVSDVNGCFVTVQDTIVPTVLLTLSDSVETACAGDPIIVRLTAGGGSGSYSYDWGTTSTSTSDTAQFALASTATLTVVVTVTDNVNGCTIIATIPLQGVAPVLVTLDNIQNIACGATAPGQIDLTVVGGTTPYNYVWSDASTAASLTSTTTGSFSVTVTDDNGCTATAGPFIIDQNLDAAVSIDTINLITACDGQATGALVARSSDPSTTFAWSNGSSDSSISNLAAGTYTVVGTNSFGCTDTVSVTIIAPTLPTLDAAVQTVGTRQVSVPLSTSVTLIAGSTGFDYLWTAIADPVTGNPNIATNNTATTTATPDPAGDYWYVVTASATTNDTVCSVSDTVMVMVEQPFEGVPNAFTPNGDAVNDLFRPTFLSDEEVTTFRVFNRWGQEVYNGDENHGEGWDGTYQGTEQPTEVYIYVITYKRASEPTEREIRGEVTLIR